MAPGPTLITVSYPRRVTTVTINNKDASKIVVGQIISPSSTSYWPHPTEGRIISMVRKAEDRKVVIFVKIKGMRRRGVGLDRHAVAYRVNGTPKAANGQCTARWADGLFAR
jgi:hypothetical protein